jgi:hypothetical protein
MSEQKQCLECKVPIHEGPFGPYIVYLNEDGTPHICDKK